MGNSHLHGTNKFLGGAEDDPVSGIKALAAVMKRQKHLLVQSTDRGMKRSSHFHPK
jgi:hypothetical protein